MANVRNLIRRYNTGEMSAEEQAERQKEALEEIHQSLERASGECYGKSGNIHVFVVMGASVSRFFKFSHFSSVEMAVMV